ncbi:MAG: hypothetical protein PHU80_07480, partial [Kiritimatiellae bacterium]|nr:hypothetical protein [Kiritimatiellia bacterium]
HPVKWVGRSLDELKGTEIRLEFMLKAADLYTFRADTSVTNAVMPRRDSRQFAFAYEANETPPQAVPPWTQVTQGSGWTTGIVDGALTVDTGGGERSVYWRQDQEWTNSVTYAKGFTVEIRYRVDNVAAGVTYAFYVRAGDVDGNNTGDIYVSTNRIDCNKFTPVLTDAGGSNMDSFHTLRIAKEPGSPFFCIWKDSVFIGRGHNTELVPGYAPLMVGDWSSRSGGVFAIDYIRWDLSGAYAPEKPPTGAVAAVR